MFGRLIFELLCKKFVFINAVINVALKGAFIHFLQNFCTRVTFDLALISTENQHLLKICWCFSLVVLCIIFAGAIFDMRYDVWTIFTQINNFKCFKFAWRTHKMEVWVKPVYDKLGHKVWIPSSKCAKAIQYKQKKKFCMKKIAWR